MEKQKFGVAVIGCGTVGTAVASALVRDEGYLFEKTGVPLTLTSIVDIDFSRARAAGLPEALFEKDFQKVLDDKSIKLIVELVGGTGFAKDVIKKTLAAGKHAVTANKALLAHHGGELYPLARKNGVALAFEASCGGGIPIIRALYDGLIANRIDALFGILNGTCNYILTEMTQKGRSYQDVLAQAQRDGLAEADPTLDVSGMDTAHKLAILGSLAYGRRVDLEKIPVEGIDTLDSADVAFGRELGYTVKLLGVAVRMENGISLRVRPTFIAQDHPLAWVSGPFNAVSVYGSVVGHTMYYGRGAGGSATSSAVVADIVSCALGTADAVFRNLKIWPDVSEAAVQLPIQDIVSRYYLRLMVEDKPGVFAALAAILGKYSISISSVLQKEPQDESASVVPVVITTHRAKEGDVAKALEEIDRLETTRGTGVCINILDEHEETI